VLVLPLAISHFYSAGRWVGAPGSRGHLFSTIAVAVAPGSIEEREQEWKYELYDRLPSFNATIFLFWVPIKAKSKIDKRV
jgi:hypothetical protein